MQEVFDFFGNLFKSSDFRSYWQSGSWTDFHGWFYILSDLLVWSAYFVIPLVILNYAIKSGKSFKFNKLSLLFASFILLCGATFLVDALMFWIPLFRLSALIRFITGIISWVAVFHAVKHLPRAFTLRTQEAVQGEIETREQVEKELKLKNEQLQEAERLAKLGYIKWDVKKEKVEYSDSVPEILELKKDQKLHYGLISELIHPDDVKHLEKVIDTIFIKKFFPNFYCRINIPGGEVKHLLVVGQVILSHSGAIATVKGTIQDVTEQRLYIQKIQTQNQRLKDIAWIQSHKVRAPVASILGLIQLFNKEAADDPVNIEVLDGIEEAAHTLDSVIKEINAKTENGADEKEAGNATF